MTWTNSLWTFHGTVLSRVRASRVRVCVLVRKTPSTVGSVFEMKKRLSKLVERTMWRSLTLRNCAFLFRRASTRFARHKIRRKDPCIVRSLRNKTLSAVAKAHRAKWRARSRTIAIAGAWIITVFQLRRAGAAVLQQFLPRSAQNATPHRHFSPIEQTVRCARFESAPETQDACLPTDNTEARFISPIE